MKLESVPARLTGLAWSAIAIGMLFSAIVGVLEGDSDVTGLVVSGLVVGAAGLVVLRSTVIPARQNSASAFAGVAWTWLLVSLAGVLPYLLTGTIDWSNADDALFESVSGFTCSGSTILSSLEDVDRGVLFWRSLSQWFGGMGLIVLAVAVLPALRVGGLELVAAEAPGPTSDRLTARVGRDRQAAVAAVCRTHRGSRCGPDPQRARFVRRGNARFHHALNRGLLSLFGVGGPISTPPLLRP